MAVFENQKTQKESEKQYKKQNIYLKWAQNLHTSKVNICFSA